MISINNINNELLLTNIDFHRQIVSLKVNLHLTLPRLLDLLCVQIIFLALYTILFAANLMS